MMKKKIKEVEKPVEQEVVNDVGRPLRFKTVEELQTVIDGYFDSCQNSQGDIIRPYTITGLALHLETTRQVILNYEAREQFTDTIKRAKLKIENFAEESLFTSKQTAGVIFNLVNNHKWINKQDVESFNTNNNTNQDLTNLEPSDRRARIDELNARRRNGTHTAT
jgi:hypothetical protein